MAREERSKGFRCTLPRMREDQVQRVQRWAAESCALSAVFSDATGKLVLVALRDQARPAASFSRTVRSALRKFAIDDTHLKGKWLSLVSAEEAILLCRGSEITIANQPAPVDSSAGDGDVKKVTLR